MGSTQSTFLSSASSSSSSSSSSFHLNDPFELRRNMNRYLQPPKAWSISVKVNSKHVKSAARWDLYRQPGITFDDNKISVDQICSSSILLALPPGSINDWREAIITGAYRHDGVIKCQLNHISPIPAEIASQIILPSYQMASSNQMPNGKTLTDFISKLMFGCNVNQIQQQHPDYKVDTSDQMTIVTCPTTLPHHPSIYHPQFITVDDYISSSERSSLQSPRPLPIATDTVPMPPIHLPPQSHPVCVDVMGSSSTHELSGPHLSRVVTIDMTSPKSLSIPTSLSGVPISSVIIGDNLLKVEETTTPMTISLSPNSLPGSPSGIPLSPPPPLEKDVPF